MNRTYKCTAEENKILSLIFSALILLLLYFVLYKQERSFILFLGIVFLAFYLLKINLNRIIIDDIGIHSKSILKTSTIKWKDLSVYGGFIVKYGSGTKLADKDSLINSSGPYRKLIFLSTDEYERLGVESNPLRWNKPNGNDFIGFTYRREALDSIEFHIKRLKLDLKYYTK